MKPSREQPRRLLNTPATALHKGVVFFCVFFWSLHARRQKVLGLRRRKKPTSAWRNLADWNCFIRKSRLIVAISHSQCLFGSVNLKQQAEFLSASLQPALPRTPLRQLGSGQTPGELLTPLVLNSILTKALEYSLHGDTHLAGNFTFALRYLPETFHPHAPDSLNCLELRYKVGWGGGGVGGSPIEKQWVCVCVVSHGTLTSFPQLQQQQQKTGELKGGRSSASAAGMRCGKAFIPIFPLHFSLFSLIMKEPFLMYSVGCFVDGCVK